MKIILVRHGQPDFNPRRWVGVRNVSLCLQQYKDARVTEGRIDENLLQKIDASTHVMTSALARAQDSASRSLQKEPEVTDLLNESELPHPKSLIMPLPWSVLLVVCRIGWGFGYRANAQGLRLDSQRARRAAALLVERASEHGSVVVFGHGVMNRLIARELKKLNWAVESKTGSGYWSWAVLGV